MKNKTNNAIMAAFYLFAGINHFISPAFYYPLIPPYFGHAESINILSGLAEIACAALLLYPPTKKWACHGIILLLLAFVPAHIYMLKTGICLGASCAPEWALWLRLILLQPMLILWAWKNRL